MRPLRHRGLGGEPVATHGRVHIGPKRHALRQLCPAEAAKRELTLGRRHGARSPPPARRAERDDPTGARDGDQPLDVAYAPPAYASSGAGFFLPKIHARKMLMM